MTDNASSFGRQASQYRAARPTYPDALFDWIADEAPGRGLAWDAGTGSGQAARALAARFDAVRATDADPAQIEAAARAPNVTYACAPAERSGLPDASADAVTAATALHWFDLPAFWAEVSRVSRPGAVFAAWSYVWPQADAETERRLVRPLMDLIEPYWSDGNRLCWRGYPPGEVGFPLEPLTPPPFACALSWTPAQLAGFVRSWSAHLRAREDGHGAALAGVEREALAALGDAPRRVALPLVMLAGRVD